MDLEELTEEELKIYRNASERFSKERTYRKYTEKKAFDLRDSLQKDYAKRAVELYKNHKLYYDILKEDLG